MRGSTKLHKKIKPLVAATLPLVLGGGGCVGTADAGTPSGWRRAFVLRIDSQSRGGCSRSWAMSSTTGKLTLAVGQRKATLTATYRTYHASGSRRARRPLYTGMRRQGYVSRTHKKLRLVWTGSVRRPGKRLALQLKPGASRCENLPHATAKQGTKTSCYQKGTVTLLCAWGQVKAYPARSGSGAGFLRAGEKPQQVRALRCKPQTVLPHEIFLALESGAIPFRAAPGLQLFHNKQFRWVSKTFLRR